MIHASKLLRKFARHPFAKSVEHAILKNMMPAELFDKDWYQHTYGQSCSKDIGINDFLKSGISTDHSPNPWFDPSWYAERYEIRKNRNITAFKHFVLVGLGRGLLPCPGFEPWLTRLVDITGDDKATKRKLAIGRITRLVNTSKSGVLQRVRQHVSFLAALFVPIHYQRIAGLKEKSDPFDAFMHFLEEGLPSNLMPTPLFNEEIYREMARAKGVSNFDTEPSLFIHWLVYGVPNRVVPTLLFDENYYRIKIPEVVKNDVWGFEHFVYKGIRNSGSPHYKFESNWYRKTHDLDESEVQTFYHYLLVGDHQGFRPSKQFGYPDDMYVMSKQTHSRLEQLLNSQRADRLAKRLNTEPFSEAIQRAESLQPKIIKPLGYRRINIPPYVKAEYPVVKRVRKSLRHNKYENIVCIPHCRMGGAALIAGALCKALRRTLPDEKLLLIRTELSVFLRPKWFPEDMESMDLVDLCGDLEGQERWKILLDVLIGTTPKRIFNVNSRLAWDVFVQYGDQLNLWSKLYAYMFCYDYNKDGKRVGYPVEFFDSTFSNLHRLIADNQYLIEDLACRHRLPKESKQKLVTLWTPFDAKPDCSIHAKDVLEGKMSHDKWRAFWSGRMDRQKRFDLVIELAKEMPKLEIWVWGQAVLDESPDLNNLPPNVSYRGVYEEFEELPMEQCDFWLYTSEWDGLPTVLVELGIRGVSTVSSLVGGIGGLINEQTAWPVVDALSVKAYENTIKTLMRSPSEAIKRAENFQKLTQEQHDPSRYEADLAAALQDL